MTAVEKLLEELSTITDLSKATLLRPIVPIEEWVESPYYLGDTCYELYPKYKKHLISIFDEDRTEEDYIDEVVMRCSIGTGKTSLANVILIRKLYELSCYTDVRPLYNLMTSKKLIMVYFSITREVAEQTGYSQLRDMIANIPYFQEYFQPNTKKTYDIEFPEHNMAITSGSRAINALGGDVIASVIDEGDFYGSAGGQDTTGANALSKAQSLYASIRKRARSRFMIGGRNYSLNMIISSPTYASGFISKLIDDNRSNPHVYIIEETLWSVKPKGTYSDEMFLVFKGTPMLDPQIVDDPDFFNTLLASLYLPQKEFKSHDIMACLADLPLDIQQHFIQIPIDFKRDFEIDLITALQDIASVPTSPLGRLFTSEKYYQKAVRGQVSPMTQNCITISTSKNDLRTIQNYFKPGYKPEHPELSRYLHFDYSITGDECGVACSYAEVLDRADDGTVTKRVTTEWMMQITPPKKPEQMDLRKARSIAYYLRDVLHLRIGLITFDSYASEEAIQSLRQDGFNVEIKSLDRDDKAYTDMMQLYYQELWKHPDHPRYKEELFNLVHYRAKHKVDHPAGYDKGCLSWDTKVRLLSGKVLTMEELYNSDYSAEFVIGLDLDNKSLIYEPIKEVVQQKVHNKLYRFTLDNGETFITTDDHLILCRDSEFRRADELSVGDSLMPINITDKVGWGNANYLHIQDPYSGKSEPIHKSVADFFGLPHADLSDGSKYEVIHHKDLNKHNNLPINLERMSLLSHRKLHSDMLIQYNKSDRGRLQSSINGKKIMKQLWSDPDYVLRKKQQAHDQMVSYNKSDNHRSRIKELHKQGIYKHTHDRLAKHAKEHAFTHDDCISKFNSSKYAESFDLLKVEKPDYTWLYTCKCKKCGNIRTSEFRHIDKCSGSCKREKEKISKIKSIYHCALDNKVITPTDKFSIDMFKDLRKDLINSGLLNKSYLFVSMDTSLLSKANVPLLNHKITNIEIIDNKKHTYDIILDHYHNFLLDSGIVVHNCTDAAVGSAHSALINKDIYESLRADDVNSMLTYL